MDPSTIALRELSFVKLVDQFIDSQLAKHGANHRITLYELWRYLSIGYKCVISASPYGTTAESLLIYVELRSYLWKLEEDTYLKKQSPEWRSFFVDVLEFMQKRGQKEDWGTTLNSLGSHIGACAPSIKRELGKGNEVIKSTLLQYPTLFVLDPFDSEPTFVNRAMVVDKVILLAEVYKFSNPAYLEGVGTITKVLGKAGFLKDDASDDTVYFKLADLVGGLPSDHKFKATEKYRFKAVISVDFEDKKTENKWAAFYMEPVATNPLVEGKAISSISPKPNSSKPVQSIASGTDDSFLPSLKDHLTDPWLADVSTRLTKLDEGISKLSVKAIDRKSQGTTAVFRQETMAIGTSEQSAKKVHMVISSGKRDRMTQTEPIDEREQIIRMLHKNPELIGFVKTYIRAVEH